MDNKYSVKELLDLALQYRVLRVKVGPIELELSPTAFGVAAPAELPFNEGKIPTAEEFQFMAGLQEETEEPN